MKIIKTCLRLSGCRTLQNAICLNWTRLRRKSQIINVFSQLSLYYHNLLNWLSSFFFIGFVVLDQSITVYSKVNIVLPHVAYSFIFVHTYIALCDAGVVLNFFFFFWLPYNDTNYSALLISTRFHDRSPGRFSFDTYFHQFNVAV